MNFEKTKSFSIEKTLLYFCLNFEFHQIDFLISFKFRTKTFQIKNEKENYLAK